AVVKSFTEAAMEFSAGISADGLQLSDRLADIAPDRVLAAKLTSAYRLNISELLLTSASREATAVYNRSLGRFATSKARGRCLTTALHIDYGDQDPAISLPTATITLRFEMLASPEAFRKSAARAWPIILKNLRATLQNRQWRKVNGLISGTISVLLSAGWGPQGPWKWAHPTGDKYEVSEDTVGSDPDWEPFLEVFRDTL
ncbi:unnamed protein product, partial [Prorocentrum cordatum]